MFYFFFVLFFWFFGPGHPLVMKLNFYKPTILKIHPPICGITAHATMPGGLEHSNISFCSMLLAFF
jgi:hypothetical protein